MYPDLINVPIDVATDVLLCSNFVLKILLNVAHHSASEEQFNSSLLAGALSGRRDP